MRYGATVRLVGVASILLVTVSACAEGEREVQAGSDSAAQETGSVQATGQRGSEPISDDTPYERLPVIDAYYEGEKAWFIHTDVSDSAMAQRLSRMVGYRTMHVPELASVPEGLTGEIYVFRNGVDRSGAEPWGGGPFQYQIDVLGSVPGDEGYSPLRTPHMVVWKESATPRVLRSVQEIRDAEAAGELTVKATDVVVNAPVVKWPTEHLGGDARMPGEGTGPGGS